MLPPVVVKLDGPEPGAARAKRGLWASAVSLTAARLADRVLFRHADRRPRGSRELPDGTFALTRSVLRPQDRKKGIADESCQRRAPGRNVSVERPSLAIVDIVCAFTRVFTK
jgi:hypothetical protein